MNKDLVKYVDSSLGFYFDGGFNQMVIDAELGKEEIKQWASIAYLFNSGVDRFKIESDNDKKNFVSVVEELLSALEIEVMAGDPIESFDLSEIGEGYDFGRDKFEGAIHFCFDIVKKDGVELYRII